MKFKVDPAKVLSITATALGVIGTILSAKVESNERKNMKEELRKELLEDLSK